MKVTSRGFVFLSLAIGGLSVVWFIAALATKLAGATSLSWWAVIIPPLTPLVISWAAMVAYILYWAGFFFVRPQIDEDKEEDIRKLYDKEEEEAKSADQLHDYLKELDDIHIAEIDLGEEENKENNN